MSRQLVVCLDGTGNRFSHTPTNILRLRRSFGSEDVLAYYDQGLGTFGLKEALFEWQKLPARICGLAFGWGLKRTVEDAYSFLAEHYREGDQVYLFGFSRGAYTARVLAALIYACGLVEPHQLNMFDYAWAMLIARKKVNKAGTMSHSVASRVSPASTSAPDFDLQNQFKSTFGRAIIIRFMGLFDTVKSVGWIYDPTIIPYTAKNPIVQTVRHAQSIDERRCFFRQNSWSNDATQETDVKQVWFAGVHSDIGGGYDPESSQLASIALCWMLSEAIADGLRVNQNRCISEMQVPMGVPPDLMADMHDSMTRGWKFAEWVPQYVWSFVDNRRHFHIGAMPPFGKPRSRVLPLDPAIHVSVKKRLDERPDYRPPNLKKPYEVISDNPNSPCV